MGEDQVRRDQAFPDQAAGTVEIAQDQVQQFRALDQAGLDPGPFTAADEQRYRVELPGPVEAVLYTIDIVRGTVAAQHAHGVLLALLQYLGAHGIQRVDDVAPVLAHLARFGAHLVVTGRRLLVDRGGGIADGRIHGVRISRNYCGISGPGCRDTPG